MEASSPHLTFQVVAVNEEGAAYDYGRKVKWEIDHPNPRSYAEAADWINRHSQADIISIQHELGIFGGYQTPDRLIPLLERVKIPVITTLHTVLPHPNPRIKEIIRHICFLSSRVTVMANVAGHLLADDYGVDRERMVTIPHGVPELPRISREQAKRKLKLKGRKVLSTFGLINRGKGIEYVIQALPRIISHHPEVIYLVLGETHPNVRREEGESYRNSLIELVKELHLENYVKFNNRFLTQDELVKYLHATDIYITPYLNRDQITSGTLAYAVGAGKAIVSTPFFYAQEVLAEGRGMMAEYHNPNSIARCINQTLGVPGMKEYMEQETYRYGKNFVWSIVAQQYAALFSEVVEKQRMLELTALRLSSTQNLAEETTSPVEGFVPGEDFSP